MQRAGQLWQRYAAYWASLGGQRLTEYALIAAYSCVALASLIVAVTAKAGTWFGRAVETNNSAARPELKPIFKQLVLAGADFSSGASLLVVAALIVYWGRRGNRAPAEAQVHQGPPFLL